MMSTATVLALTLSTATANFCGEISPYLPSECSCSERQYGATVSCSVNFFSEDTITITGDLQLCSSPAEADLVITDTKFGIHHELAGLVAGKALDFPIPGLSLDLPDIQTLVPLVSTLSLTSKVTWKICVRPQTLWVGIDGSIAHLCS